MLALAEHILDSKAANFDASKFHDRYEAVIVAMLNEKKAGLPVSVQRQIPRIVAGTDLMAALRQSIEAEGKPAAPAKETPAAKPTASKGKKTAKRNPDQREMLLPIPRGAPAAAKGAAAKKTSASKKSG